MDKRPQYSQNETLLNNTRYCLQSFLKTRGRCKSTAITISQEYPFVPLCLTVKPEALTSYIRRITVLTWICKGFKTL